MPCFEKGVPQNEGVEGCATTAVSAGKDGVGRLTIAETGEDSHAHYRAETSRSRSVNSLW